MIKICNQYNAKASDIRNAIDKMQFLDVKFKPHEKFDIPFVNMVDTNIVVQDDYYILYFDILGYKDKIDKYGEEYFLHIIYAVMDTINSVYEDAQKGKLFGYHIFSDNIIIFVKKDNDLADAQKIILLIKDAFIIQRNLMGQYGILIRGAITQGKLFYGKDFVYGKGLINAYMMEDNQAVYPRIIIDKECMMDLRQMMEPDSIIEKMYHTVEEVICIDSDNEYFIGYINVFDFSYERFANYLYYHKNLIIAYLKYGELEDEEKEKYIWCKKYHNAVCDLYQLDDVKIL